MLHSAVVFRMQSFNFLFHFNQIFREKKKIRIGYYDNIDFFHAAPACKRAVHEAKVALEKAGYEVNQHVVPVQCYYPESYYQPSVETGPIE